MPQIEPMRLSRILAPFDNPDFVFELKYDGFRSLAYIADARCSLVFSWFETRKMTRLPESFCDARRRNKKRSQIEISVVRWRDIL